LIIPQVPALPAKFMVFMGCFEREIYQAAEKGFPLLRQAQHEGQITKIFKLSSVRPERVKG